MFQSFSKHPNLTITIVTGTEHFRAGEFALSIDGGGSARVVQKNAGKTNTFELVLTEARVDEFGALLAKHRFSAKRTSKLPRQPGDSPVRLSAERDGEKLILVDVWNGDRFQDSDLDAMLKAANTLVYEVSGGKIGSAPH